MQQPLGAEVVGVGVAGALAGEDADAAAGADALAGGFNNLLVHAQRGGRNRLEVEVGVVSASREGLAQATFKKPLGEAEFVEKIAFMTGVRGSSRIIHRVFSLRCSSF